MKKLKWCIENFTNSEDYRGLIEAVKDSGRECYVIGPHNHFDFDPSIYAEDDCVIFQGSIQMVRHVRDRLLPKNCYPIAYCNFTSFLCSRYFLPLKHLLFNDRHAFVTFEHLKENKFEIYREFGKEALIFIRPDSGDKPFSGQLLDLQDFDRFCSNKCNYQEDDIVIVSTPKTINGEWRFVCSKHGDIIAQSTYLYQGQKTVIPSAPNGAADICRKVFEVGWYPDSVFCVDVCDGADGKFWLLELTSFSSAGLYACNKRAIVDKVSEIAEKNT